MEKKVILITGATQGIGKITATTLAKQGHQVVIHGRNKEKLEAVAKEIKAVAGGKSVDIITADLFSLADVKRMAEEFNSRYDKLDVLINNAGAILNKDRETTKEGFEKTMALNLYAPTLLMQLLSGALAKSRQGRIINLSSAMHRRAGKPDFSDFQFEKKYSTNVAYGTSKLYLIWVSRHMVKYLKEKGINNVTVNVCHPGAVATNFGQDAKKGFVIDMIFKIALRFMPKPEVGARTSIYLATSPEVAKTTGEFWDQKMKLEKPDDKNYSVENEQLVWDHTQKVLAPYL